MAVYAPGETVRIQWPAKNHANVGTQRNVQVFFGKGPGLGDDFSHITSKANWISTYPGLDRTFSNCRSPSGGALVGPGVDGAECLGDFVVPADLQSGVYSVIWWWEFNAGEFYSTCYDVLVTDGGGSAPPGTGDPNDECLPSNLPADTCSLSSVETGIDGISLIDAPSTIPGSENSQFTMKIKYNANSAQNIVVDILDQAGNFYGGGLSSSVAVSAGSGEISYSVTVTQALSAGQSGVYLKAWNVRTSQFSTDASDEPWRNEMTRVDYSVSVGSALVQCTPIPANCLAALSGSDIVDANPGALAGIIICVLVIVVVLFFMASNRPSVFATLKAFFYGVNSTPHMVVRGVECFLALCAFALWSESDGANSSDCDCKGPGDFLVAMGVLIWIYTGVFFTLIAIGICKCFEHESVHGAASLVQRVACYVDLVLGVLAVAAACATGYYHPDHANAKGAVACAFFLSIFLLLNGIVVIAFANLGGTAKADDVGNDAQGGGGKKKTATTTRVVVVGDQC
eukprot:g2536.t1